MGTILDKIIDVKKTELDGLANLQLAEVASRKKRSFIEKIREANEMKIIAEFKRASPSKGDINPDLNPQEQAVQYEQFGADAISVLTDTSFFKGSFADLQAVRTVVDLPILCKDFIIDQIQIDTAHKAGADIVLLIAAAMEQSKLIELYQYASEKQLEVLVEIHDEEDFQKANSAKASLIGINNRNLKTFEVDLATTERLAPLVLQSGASLISESGIKSVEDVVRVQNAGARGILVGETFMTAQDLKETFKQLKLPVRTV
ncbi:indole-3-glycerol phosphate synthase TrpC [Bacillus marasmi]|uniref:indole-3-glycerol phosphate synthase TrpC n=1 Tax=Bacillus marasmi TaxID=1926279 RepID=UPI0011CC8C97|nr:indole-3-glycerol phosphate synthase TrpC [Bacillus marasmi]